MIDIERIKEQLKKSVDNEIYGHCIRTMEEAERLALVYNTDIEKAKIAGLLHDCAKQKEKSDDNLKHAEAGAQLAEKIYKIDDIDILNAIRYHTTGREGMTDLEKVVFIADKIEPNRIYLGVEEIRALSFENIDVAIIKSLISTIGYVRKRKMTINPESERTLNYLLKGGYSI